MTNTIIGVLLDAQTARVKRASIPDDLDAYYKQLHCTTIDIVSRTIGGKRFNIVCDDEGTFKDDVRISALDRACQPILVGSLFVCKSEGGKLASLNDAEISHLLRSAKKIPTRAHPEGLAMFLNVGY